ncbi:MAG: AraC family transcriptional regulator, partial [Bacteroidaceae bacterium]|nr:AraC family transcriptional regulator [Bacteroidaceae bacterium]MBQ8455666.1 AraC family transcriptional regulator [Bacteroidaceae bacterium]
KAMSMLQSHRDINVAEVAYKCGYSQVPNFSRAFTNFFGITPTEVKTRTRKE